MRPQLAGARPSKAELDRDRSRIPDPSFQLRGERAALYLRCGIQTGAVRIQSLPERWPGKFDDPDFEKRVRLSVIVLCDSTRVYLDSKFEAIRFAAVAIRS